MDNYDPEPIFKNIVLVLHKPILIYEFQNIQNTNAQFVIIYRMNNTGHDNSCSRTSVHAPLSGKNNLDLEKINDPQTICTITIIQKQRWKLFRC